MSEMIYSVEDIKELMQALGKNKISELKIENGDFKLKLCGMRTDQAAAASVMAPQSVTASGEPAPAGTPEYSGNVVKSPIVGTFYTAPAPDREPYVRVGSQVKKGDVLFIIESMKLMNEVTSDFDGAVSEILVQNAQGVEYGQPIMCIE